MYKVEQPFNHFLNYEYNDGKEMSYMFMKSTSAISEHALPSANDIILDWTKFAKEALEGEYADAKEACWSGHYEQFGRLMYHLIDVIVRKDEYIKSKRFNKMQLDFLPQLSTAQFLVEGATSSEDRTFYRCWFDIIGHKEFKFIEVNAIEAQSYVYWKYVLSTLVIDLGNATRRRESEEIEYLHC